LLQLWRQGAQVDHLQRAMGHLQPAGEGHTAVAAETATKAAPAALANVTPCLCHSSSRFPCSGHSSSSNRKSGASRFLSAACLPCLPAVHSMATVTLPPESSMGSLASGSVATTCCCHTPRRSRCSGTGTRLRMTAASAWPSGANGVSPGGQTTREVRGAGRSGLARTVQCLRSQAEK
jgi:hypothetical protein